MATLDAFRRALDAEPWARWWNSTRFVCADFLEEQGDERAQRLREMLPGARFRVGIVPAGSFWVVTAVSIQGGAPWSHLAILDVDRRVFGYGEIVKDPSSPTLIPVCPGVHVAKELVVDLDWVGLPGDAVLISYFDEFVPETRSYVGQQRFQRAWRVDVEGYLRGHARGILTP